MRRHALSFGLLVSLAWPCVVAAGTHYVTTTGDETDAQATYDAAVSSGAPCSLRVAAKYAVAGDTVYVDDGTYTLTSVLVAVNNGGVGGPITFQGYHTTPGDHDGTRPLITTATNSTTLISVGTGGGGWVWDNFTFSNTATTRSYGCNAVTANVYLPILFSRCVFDGFSVAVMGDYTINYSLVDVRVDRCEIKNCTANGIRVAGGLVTNSYIHANSGSGVYGVTDTSAAHSILVIHNTVIYGNAVGVTLPAYASVYNAILILNSAIVSNTGDGIVGVNNVPTKVALINSIVYGNGGYGLHSYQTAVLCHSVNSAWAANTSGNTLNATLDSSNITTTLEGDPFVARTSGNFALNRTAGAGAVLRAAGISGGWPGSATTGYQDIGAVQHADPTQPSATAVLSGTTYNDGLTSGTYVEVADTDVRDGTTYGPSSTLTGLLVSPAEADVKDGVKYGAGEEYTGSLAAAGIIFVED